MFGELWKALKEILITSPLVNSDQLTKIQQTVSNPPECGINLIKALESCRLEAFLDPADIPTIAWGRTAGVKLGDICTQEEADQWLIEDYTSVWNIILGYVKVSLTQNEGGSLLSFGYNIGSEALKKSTLLFKLNSGDYSSVPAEMKKWCYITVNGEHKVSEGLVNRRKAEINLWCAGDWRAKHDDNA